MNKFKLSLLLAATAAAVPALAIDVNVSSGIVPGAFVPANQPGANGQVHTSPANLAVPSFNGALGTLTGVSYTLTYWSYAVFQGTNPGGGPTVYDYRWSLGRNLAGDLNVITEPGGPTQQFFQPEQSFLYNAAPGSFGPTSTTHSMGSFGPQAAGSPATFIGNGVTTVSFVFTPEGFSGIFGASDQNPQPDVFFAAKVDVKYTYTNDIPEPSTYAAGAVVLAGAGLILRRRMVAGKVN